MSKMRVFCVCLLGCLASSVYSQLPKLKPLKEKYMVGNMIPIEKKGKWGYGIETEKKPKEVINYVFDEARAFVDSVAIVKCDGKYGFLHRSGVFIQEPTYDEISDFDNGLAYARIQQRYMIINTKLKEICHWEQLSDGSFSFSLNDVRFNMRLVKGGNFKMGVKSNNDDLDYDAPIHEVCLSKDYWMAETEVTKQLWNIVVDNRSSLAETPQCNVTWEDCQKFLTKINNIFPFFRFRLPTEAEWEYAARNRGISTAKYAGGDDANQLTWTSENSEKHAHVIMTKKMNELGLYDMCGNVEEWCSDWYNASYYNMHPSENTNEPMTDPTGPSKGKGRVVRGGSWKVPGLLSRATYRNSHDPEYKGEELGFRMVMDITHKVEEGNLREICESLKKAKETQ